MDEYTDEYANISLVTEIKVLDHGYVKLRNLSGPTRRPDEEFDADDVDPANTARFSFDQADQDRDREDDIKLDRYLMKNYHTTPIEMIEVWLEMKMPIFVARQFVRHRTVSINEVSARYVKLAPEFYIPELENVGIKSKSNKQGRTIIEVENGGPTISELVKVFVESLRVNSEATYEMYEAALKANIPNELARCFLPLNIYTKWIWKQDLHNMMHFLKLRMHPHAQFEAREYANAIYELLAPQLPALMGMFEDRDLS